jgi:hypothetical protein
VAGWACDRRLEDCNPNGHPMILQVGQWQPICFQWHSISLSSIAWQGAHSTAFCGDVIRTRLEISKTPEVGSDLSSGVAG